jgi:hypothetical protein
VPTTSGVTWKAFTENAPPAALTTLNTAEAVANYSAINATANPFQNLTGSSSNDEGIQWNVTLPVSTGINWINVIATLNSTGSSETQNIGLWNYTSTAAYNTVASRAQSTTFANLSFNITGANISHYVSGGRMYIALYSQGGSSGSMSVQYVEYTINYISSYTQNNYTCDITPQNMTNDTWAAFSGATWSNVSKVVNSTEGSKIAWCVYANNTVNTWNSSCSSPFQYTTTSTDNTPPTWANAWSNATNNTPVNTGTVIALGVQWNDNNNFTFDSMWWSSLKVNTSGSFTNNSGASYLAGNWSNVTITMPSEQGSNYTIKIYANDSTGNQNVTGIWYWYNVSVVDVAPTWYSNSTNSTLAGTPISHNLYWNDSVGLSGYTFQYCNGTWNGTHCLGGLSFFDDFSGYNSNYVKIATFDSVDGWGSLSDTSSIATTNTVVKEGSASAKVSYMYSAGVSGIEKSIPSIDISSMDRIGFWIWKINTTKVTRYELRIGQDDGNYREYRNTTGPYVMSIYNGSSYMVWNLTENYSSSGNPDMSDIQYVRIAIYYNSGEASNTYWIVDDLIAFKFINYLSPIFSYIGDESTLQKDLYGVVEPCGYGNSMCLSQISRLDSGDHGRILYNNSAMNSPTNVNISTTFAFFNDWNNTAWLRLGSDFTDGENYSAIFISRKYNKCGVEQLTNYSRNYEEVACTPAMNTNYTVLMVQRDKNVSLYIDGILQKSYNMSNARTNGSYFIEAYAGVDTLLGNSTSVQIWNFSVSVDSVSGTNNWVNDTWTPMTSTGNWSNVTKTSNSTVGSTMAWCVYANDTSNQWNSTCSSPFTYTTTSSGTPDVIVSYGPAGTTKLLIDQNATGYGCGPDDISFWVQPENQTSGLGIFNITNNGTATATKIQAKLTGSASSGWTIMLSNSSSTPVVALSTSWQDIWLTSTTVGSKKQVWAFYNCTSITSNPGVSIQFQAV